MRKLKEYIETRGLIKKKFAERIGMKPQQLSDILEGNIGLPKKYWKKIIEETNNEITMKDLVEYFLNDKEKP